MTTLNKSIISIIPARGGSKGIPNKNIIEISGKPLIAWTIEQSISTKTISKTYVSTNDAQIAAVAEQFGAEIIWRPNELSGDKSTSESAISHALNYLKTEKQIVPDYIVFLQATSPLRKVDDIDNAILKIISEDADSLFSGAEFDDFLFWEKNGSDLRSINYDYKNRGCRQDRLPQFVENGSLYVFKPEILLKTNNRLGGKTSIYEMDFWQSWEIDTLEDVELIEFYIKLKLNNESQIKLKKLKLLVYDFDGVMTDNKAIVDENGNESVKVNRGDGLAIAMFKKLGISQMILSTEKNSVVNKRSEKLKIDCFHGVDNKKEFLLSYLKGENIDLQEVGYVGNDINDYEIMREVGLKIAPQDAVESIKKIANIITKANGGDGVIRELYDIIK
jgi:YrbI family 3-deoxy-D-manno-octulosonate 8-phosphate phosphatase